MYTYVLLVISNYFLLSKGDYSYIYFYNAMFLNTTYFLITTLCTLYFTTLSLYVQNFVYEILSENKGPGPLQNPGP